MNSHLVVKDSKPLRNKTYFLRFEKIKEIVFQKVFFLQRSYLLRELHHALTVWEVDSTLKFSFLGDSEDADIRQVKLFIYFNCRSLISCCVLFNLRLMFLPKVLQ